MESKKTNGVLTSPSLSVAISRAKAANMPKENIERAVAKGTSKDSEDLEQVTYEAYGPGGVAIIVDALTDNKNRTTQEIKHLLATFGVELASPGSALWAFIKIGSIYSPNEPLMELPDADVEKLSLLIDTIDGHGDVQQIFTNARGYENIGD